NLKLFLTFSSVLIIIIILICIVFYYSNVKEMKKQTQLLSNSLSAQFDRTLELYIEDIERLSLGIFTDPFIQDTLINDDHLQRSVSEVRVKNGIYPRLFNQAYPRSKVEGISIYTREGTVYEYSRQHGIKVRYNTEEPWE